MRGRVLLGALALAGGFGASACASARNGLGTPVDSCIRALPVAAAAVHHRGTFAGVALVGSRALRPGTVLGAALARRTTSPPRAACAVAFRGTFSSAAVDEPLVVAAGPGTMHWAVVVVTVPGNRVAGTVLSSRPPVRVGGLF